MEVNLIISGEERGWDRAAYTLDMTHGVCHQQQRAFADDGRKQHNYTQYYISDYFEYLQGQVEEVNALLVGLLGVHNTGRVPHIVQQPTSRPQIN